MLGCGRIGLLLLQKESRFTIIDKEGYTVQEDPSDIECLKKANTVHVSARSWEEVVPFPYQIYQKILKK
jgi:hypothetical protein